MWPQDVPVTIWGWRSAERQNFRVGKTWDQGIGRVIQWLFGWIIVLLLCFHNRHGRHSCRLEMVLLASFALHNAFNKGSLRLNSVGTFLQQEYMCSQVQLCLLVVIPCISQCFICIKGCPGFSNEIFLIVWFLHVKLVLSQPNMLIIRRQTAEASR